MLIPKIEEEKDRLCEKAKQEAQSAAMDQLVLLQVDSLGEYVLLDLHFNCTNYHVSNVTKLDRLSRQL